MQPSKIKRLRTSALKFACNISMRITALFAFPQTYFFDYSIFNLVQYFSTVFVMWPIFKTNKDTWPDDIFFFNFISDLKKVMRVNFRNVVQIEHKKNLQKNFPITPDVKGK